MTTQEETTPPPPADLLAGVLYPFRAIGLINRNRRLWGFVLVPILVNIVVGLLLYVGLYAAGLQAIDRIIAGEGFWLGLLGGLLQLILVLALLLGVGWLMVRFGVVLGAPWYGQLSEQLEALLTGRAPPQSALTVANIAYDIWRALQFELKKLSLALPIGLTLLLIGFIPVVGQIVATVGGIILGATVACLDFFDAPQERRRRRFREKLALIRRTLPASAGFGLVAFGLVSIPFLNLLAIPLCVTAGTILVIERAPWALEAPQTPTPDR